jgi:hypothetical protein
MTIAMTAPASTRTSSTTTRPAATRSSRPVTAVGSGLATAVRFAGHFVVACASVAVLGAETEY